MSLNDFIKKAELLDVKKFENEIKIAVLSNFTHRGLLETIKVKTSELNTNCLTYSCGYNQYSQEMLDPSSNLYKFSPDLIFLMLDLSNFFGNDFYSIDSFPIESKKEMIENKIAEIKNLINSFQNRNNSKIIIFNFPIPIYSPKGINEFKTNYGLKEMVANLNQALYDFSKTKSSVYVYDFNAFVMYYGQQNILDYRQYFFGDLKIAMGFIPKLADQLMTYVIPSLGRNRKCIVLDLDNTLWGGIIGEDGFEGIKIGTKYPGNAFTEFQRRLLKLHKQGIILAINSKNNPEDALQVIREHLDMILKEEHFASLKINWNDKVTNMKEIAEEINIGLDSLIFFDDDEINREFVKEALPMVKVIDLPKDPSFYASTLINLPDFNVLKLTEEDKQRGIMYYQQRQRNELKETVISLDEFLKNLNIKVKIKNADEFTIPRISQLTLKTNQFNLTTQRYQIEDIEKISKDKNFLVGAMEVKDKFGDSGITGVFIAKKDGKKMNVDTFLLSCRVMGRKVENVMMHYIIEHAKKENIEKIEAKYLPTKKNQPCSSFLEDFGFEKTQNGWEFNIHKDIKLPEHIELT